MRLVACPACRVQYDVTDRAEPRFACPCGATVENRLPVAVDAEVRRCASCGAPLPGDASTCEWCRAEVVRDPLRLGLICPECYARNGEAARYCAACGVTFRPQPMPVPKPELRLACVDCGTTLAARTVGEVPLHECGACHGVWAPGTALDRIVERVTANRWRLRTEEAHEPAPRHCGGNPVAEPVRYRRCPVCRQHMARRNWRRISGVILDGCPEHGTWLDADELERIAGFVMAGGLERARERERIETERAVARAIAGTPSRGSAEFAKILMERPRGGSLLDSLVRLVERKLD